MTTTARIEAAVNTDLDLFDRLIDTRCAIAQLRRHKLSEVADGKRIALLREVASWLDPDGVARAKAAGQSAANSALDIDPVCGF